MKPVALSPLRGWEGEEARRAPVRPVPPAHAGGYILSPLRGWAAAVLALALFAVPCVCPGQAPPPPAAPASSAPPTTPPTTLPAAPPAGIDAALWAKMKAIDQTAGKIEDLTADFEQKKTTPLLKKPLVSTGTVWAKGSAMLWDTRGPNPTVMRVDENQVTLYYPDQKTAEVYPLGKQLGELAASPVPRLAKLLEHFSFAPASPREFGDKEGGKEAGNSGADAPDRQAFRLRPTDPAIRDHVDHVLVLIDAKHGFILAFRLVDADNETTDIRFFNVKVNTKFDDAKLRLDLPAGVKTVRPLENLGPKS
jgi:outer membrane lipoprotein-sorting protein